MGEKEKAIDMNRASIRFALHPVSTYVHACLQLRGEFTSVLQVTFTLSDIIVQMVEMLNMEAPLIISRELQIMIIDTMPQISHEH